MRLFAALAASLIAGCASLPAGVATSECRQRFVQLDERIEAAGVRDGGEHRIQGFPYLRVNRFLASFRDEKPFETWVEQLRQLDLAARRVELKNLGAASQLAVLDRCGHELVRRELGTLEARAALREAAQVPDDYSTVARVAGLYPLAVPFLSIGIDGYQSEVRKNYARPLEELLREPRIEYRLVSGGDALARRHAPVFSVSTRGDSDRIGAPKLNSGFDTEQAVVYFHRASTRFGDRVLTQLVYTAWFAERPARGALDSYAGTLDGIVWRVTLDEDNRPLAYDTIHACGCYHHWFPVQSLKLRQDLADSGDPPLLPQSDLAPQKPLLLVDSDTHFVSRVVSQASSKPKKGTKRVAYKLRSYSDLLTLGVGDGRTRSLFGEDGIVAGSERGERRWLWMSGINSPGAMRQWGRHATAFIGRRHFDDARILESVFVP
ncbi:MAG: hypothetical protein AABY95_03155 [Pseudomonadota bacterium]